MNLKHLTDKVLLEDLKMLVASERVFLTKILHHLKEVEDRKLYADLKYTSFFDYVVKELGYSEAAASRRIQAARLLKQIPALEKKIESGSLNLTNLAKAGRMFKENEIKNPAKQNEILKKIENKSSRECEKELISFMPQAPLPPEKIRPISSQMNQLKINVSDKTLSKMSEAKSLMNLSQINDHFFEKLTINALENLKFKKFKTRTSSPQNEESRYLTAETKREVFQNSQGVCENCGSLFMLQFDHVEAFAMGGKSTPANLRLLCFSCNQRARIRARL